jgi:hypothetical protein
MNVGELLDELRTGLLRDTSTIKSGDPDTYWTDEQLVRYLDDAHNRFSRLALCIHDATTPQVTQVVLQNGIDTYSLHRSVISVLSARHQDDAQDLVRLSRDRATTYSNPFTETFEFVIVPTPGKPNSFTTDESIVPNEKANPRIRFFGVPDSTQAGKVVYLRTIRKPLKKFSLDDTDDEPEIPEEYHLELVEWAAWRALRNWDIDSEDRAKADAHKKRFEDAILECKRDVLRKRWQALGWSFGQNAYAGYVKN